MSFGILHVAPILPHFQARYPELNVDIVLDDRTTDLVDEGFDLAIHSPKVRTFIDFISEQIQDPPYWEP
ncbi:MAG: LysR substrate-binding domain-containing protein [Candidatus Thiodiazotropha sp.]